MDSAPPQLIDSLPIEMFVTMAVNLKPEHIETGSKKLAVDFEDLQSTYLIEHVHCGYPKLKSRCLFAYQNDK